MGHAERVNELTELVEEQTVKPLPAVSSEAKQRRAFNPLRCTDCLFSSRRRKIAFRDGIALALLSSMIFIPGIVEVAGSRITLVPILAFYFAKRPFSGSSVGTQVMMFVNSLLSLVFLVCFALFTTWASQDSLFVLCLLYFLINLCCFTVGSFTPSMRLPSAFIIVLLASMLPKYYALFNYTSLTVEQAWQDVYFDIGQVLFVGVVALAVHTLLALLCFPWFVSEDTRHLLGDTYEEVAKFFKILADKAPVEPQEGGTVVPEAPWLDSRSIDQLRQLTDEIDASYAKLFTGLYQLVLETRWYFSGSGMKYCEACLALREVIRSTRVISNEVLLIAPGGIKREAASEGMELESAEREVAVLLGAVLNQLTQGLTHVATLLDQRSPHAIVKGQTDSEVHGEAYGSDIESKSFPADKESLSREIPALLSKMAKAQIERTRKKGDDSQLSVELHGRNLYNRIAAVSLAALNILELVPNCIRTADALKRETLSRQRLSTLIDWIPTVYGAGLCCTGTYSDQNAFDLLGLNGAQPGTTCYYVEPELTRLQRMYRKLALLFSSAEFKNGLKTAIGSTVLFLLAVLPATYERYSDVAVSNALMTFQSALRQFHLGLVINRAINRLLGVLCGYLFASIAWTLVGDALDGWALWLLNLPFQAVLIYVSSEKPLVAYIFYGLNKEMLTISSVEFHANTGLGPFQPNDLSIWQRGGYITGFTILGSVLAFLVGACMWPSTGASKLRSLISDLLLDLSGEYEHQLIRNMHNVKASGTKRSLDDAIALSDAYIDYRLYYMTRPLIAATTLEILHLKLVVSLNKYRRALGAVKGLHSQLWKLRLLQNRLQGALNSQTRTSNVREPISTSVGLIEAGIGIEDETKTIFAAALRSVSPVLLLLSSSLKLGTPLPEIRPSILKPQLFVSELAAHEELIIGHHQEFLEAMSESYGNYYAAWLGVLKLALADMSAELNVVVEFCSDFVLHSQFQKEFNILENRFHQSLIKKQKQS